jgi:hypothetical protein
MVGWLNLSPVNINRITQGLEGVKTDSNRQNDLKRMMAGLYPELEHQAREGVDKKVEVFKKSEHSEVDKHRQPE